MAASEKTKLLLDGAFPRTKKEKLLIKVINIRESNLFQGDEVMGLFHKYLTDALKAAQEENYDEAVKILEYHQLNHVNKSEKLYGVIQRMIDSLNLYSHAVNQATIYAKERKKPGVNQQIGVAEDALRGLKKDIKNLLKLKRIELE